MCSCTASTSALSFGSYSPVTASPKDATTQVQVDCTGAVALLGTVQVQASAGGSGNALQRRMTSVGNSLAYNIYADSARTQILGSGTGATTTINTPLNGLLFFSTSAAVYGRVPAGQWVASGLIPTRSSSRCSTDTVFRRKALDFRQTRLIYRSIW